MSAARRTRPSSRRTATRSGSRCAARTMSRCSTARPSRRRRASRFRTARACRSSRPTGSTATSARPSRPRRSSISVADHQIVGHVKQDSPFCPNIAATPDGKQVWFTLKDVGKTMVFDARPPFAVLKTIDTGPITNHVNFARNANGTFAYVTVGGLNEVKVFRTDDFRAGRDHSGRQAAARRLAVGRRQPRSMSAWRTPTRSPRSIPPPTRSSPPIPIGQAPQAIAYVPNAVPEGDGTQRPAAARRRRRGGAPHALAPASGDAGSRGRPACPCSTRA